MPNTKHPLPIRCPKCHQNGSTLVVKSLTVITMTCSGCRHMWAAEIDSLPVDIQRKIYDVLRESA